MAKKAKEMSDTDHKETATADFSNPETGASVDKIRDILFGSQIKNYEARFARLEENLVRETVELKETMRRRFESLEGFFKLRDRSPRRPPQSRARGAHRQRPVP